MKPALSYDTSRRIGRVTFANGHVAVLHGSREFCEKWIRALEIEAERDYQRALASGRGEGEAKTLRDRVLSDGALHRS